VSATQSCGHYSNAYSIINAFFNTVSTGRLRFIQQEDLSNSRKDKRATFGRHTVQYDTAFNRDQGDDCRMNKPVIVEPTPQVNERLWQAWVVKNRELDRRGAVRRRRFLIVLLVLVLVGAVLRSYLG
jgi:hypothetical protein